MPLPLIHHPGYTIELPTRHPFPMAKFRELRRVLGEEPVGRSAQWLSPQPVSETDLARVHERGYLDAFLHGGLDQAAQRRSGFRWSEALVERTRLEVGGTLLAMEVALETGLACNTAGGTHHAHANFASGYCLLNDLAVAAAKALAKGWAKRILIVDLDVHQGDGTARLFQDTPEVFTLSLHGAENFPARKQHSDLDIPLPRNTDDDAYLATLARYLPWLLMEFAPQLVLYDAGVDVHKDDRLGHLALSDDGLACRDRFVLEECRDAGIPVAAVIGGGYDRDLNALAHRHAQLHRVASEFV
ncbi:histone deacetylase [Pistricoccus aurantiacus]|uniref:Histone deacetylase n=1 Tax=Pistricoccus aurantiacus TaxID=1883414 RepID=A0A5B8SX55_9GAMM|nr:histone deacetylase [Pistricoccus aurantiacus]QEA40694.1 histone deacetylase [Pistricoccus aurantiacus]